MQIDKEIREEIEQKMDERARKYVETHDPEIIKELYQLSRELERMEKLDRSGLFPLSSHR